MKKLKKKLNAIICALLTALLVITAPLTTFAAPLAEQKLDTYKLTQKDLLAKVAEKAQKDSFGMAAFCNIESISTDDIRAASQYVKQEKKNIYLYFDTYVNKEVTGCLIMNPTMMLSTATGDIKLTVDISEKTNKDIKAKFEKEFGQTVAVMKTAHTGSFGMSVLIAGKLDLGKMDTTKLCVYIYNAELNQHSQLAAPQCTVDDSGFVFLASNTGGYIVITNYDQSAKR